MSRICVHAAALLRVMINYGRHAVRRLAGVIGVGLGAAGAAKLASTKSTRDNFARLGYPRSGPVRDRRHRGRRGRGGDRRLRASEGRPVAAIGTLCSMAGTLATHIRAGDSAPNYVRPALLAAAAARVLAEG